jgi:acetylglutamate/LysW-gamma-L-alpha-aminoadipate kinase
LGATALVILSNVPGLLASYTDPDSLVRHLPASALPAAESMAQGRMKRKVLAAGEALRLGVSRVILGDSRRSEPLRSALAGAGTVIGEPLTHVIDLPMAWSLPALESVEVPGA